MKFSGQKKIGLFPMGVDDLHVHTRLSYDGKGEAEDYVKALLAHGGNRVGFSEHFDYDLFLQGEDVLPDLNEYTKVVNGLKERFPQVKILKGIELGFSSAAAPFYRELCKRENFDYVILSVHTVGNRGDCYYPEFFKGLKKEEAYGMYLSAVLESVTSGVEADIVGHIGYVARYAPYADRALRYCDFKELFDKIFDEMLARGLCMEINSSGYSPLNGGNGAGSADGGKNDGGFADGGNGADAGSATLPPVDIIEEFAARGGKFTCGSDSHTVLSYTKSLTTFPSLLSSLKLK